MIIGKLIPAGTGAPANIAAARERARRAAEEALAGESLDSCAVPSTSTTRSSRRPAAALGRDGGPGVAPVREHRRRSRRRGPTSSTRSWPPSAGRVRRGRDTSDLAQLLGGRAGRPDEERPTPDRPKREGRARVRDQPAPAHARSTDRLGQPRVAPACDPCSGGARGEAASSGPEALGSDRRLTRRAARC